MHRELKRLKTCPDIRIKRKVKTCEWNTRSLRSRAMTCDSSVVCTSTCTYETYRKLIQCCIRHHQMRQIWNTVHMYQPVLDEQTFHESLHNVHTYYKYQCKLFNVTRTLVYPNSTPRVLVMEFPPMVWSNDTGLD
jgi:hypothetical protein